MSRTCLVIQEARIGDLIQSKPLIDGLSKAGFATTLLVRPGVFEAAQALAIGDEILSWPSFGNPHTDLSLLARLSGAREFVRLLRNKRLDRAVVLNHHGTGILLPRLLGLPVSGFTQIFDPKAEDDPSSPLTGWPGYLVASSRGIRALNRIHLSDMWRGFAGSLPPTPPVERRTGCSAGPVIVVLGGRSPYRRLEPPALLAFIKALRRIDGGEVILTGGPEDRDVGALLEKEGGAGVINMAGKTGMRELSDLLAGAGIVVSPDTAPLHLAASLGVPTVGLFFASALCFETGAYREGAISLVTSMDCYPCAGEGSFCSHRSCRESPAPDVLAEIVSAVRRGAKAADLPNSLGERLAGFELWEAVSSPSGLLQRVLTPRVLTRERMLARLFRRFYWRYLEGGTALPTLLEELEMEGNKTSQGFASEASGNLPDPLWMVRLERGITLYSRTREQKISEVQRRRINDRLASEFPMIWPILHHLEWVEGGRGDVRSLVWAAETLVSEIQEAARLSAGLGGKRIKNKERAHVAI